MKLSYKWICKYVDLPKDLSMKKLSYDLTMRTVEVESIKNLADDYKNIVVGQIKKILPHPDADRLRLVIVDLGPAGEKQIVCGGKNLFEGHYVAVCLPGSYARWHGKGDPVLIEAGSLRGQDSYGMIAAASELGLSALFDYEEEGEILDLSDERTGLSLELSPGLEIAELLGLDDLIIEIENKSITNRPDLWCHYGIARELAAIYGKSLAPMPEIKILDLPKYPLEIQDKDLCSRFLAAKYTGVRPIKSKFDLALDLIKVDIRPINVLVDITNYVMMAYGNPSHAYDANHIEGGLIVRRAKKGEKLELLDKTQLELDENNLVISDHKKALGLAGIMGGSHDSILPDTSELVFEAACFNPANIRKTAQSYGLRSEASSRNEKGIDTQRIDAAFALTDQMLREYFPDLSLVAFSDEQASMTENKELDISISWLNRRLGRQVDREEVEKLLRPLGFIIKKKSEDQDIIHIISPSWRSTGDISLPDDILEEVARMIGYENFTLTPSKISLSSSINQRDKNLDRRIREYLAFTGGFREITSYPWVKDKYLSVIDFPKDLILSLAQAPAPDQRHLRPSHLPNLLEAIVNNTRYFDEFSIFEVGQVYKKGEMSPSSADEILPEQHKEIAGAIVGQDPEELFYRMKGILEEISSPVQLDAFTFDQEEKMAWADNEAWLNIYDGEILIGSFGLLSNKSKYDLGLKFHDACLFEINMDLLEAFESRTNYFEALPLFPHVFQDLSILVDEEVSWQEIRSAVSNLAEDVSFIDEYRGKQIEKGKKSVTLRLELAAEDKTLTNEEIEEAMSKIRKALEVLGSRLRDN